MTSRKATAVLLALLVTVTSFTALPKDAKAAASTKFEALDFSYDRDDVYTNYIKKYENAAHPEVEIAVPAASFASAANPETVTGYAELDGMESVLEFGEDVQSVTYNVNIPQEGLYNIKYSIKGHENIKNDMEFAVEINGESPFNEAMTIQSPRGFKNSDEGFKVITDEDKNRTAEFSQDRENDMRPNQEKLLKWRTEWLVDSGGLIDEPLSFYFNAGENTITFTTVGEPFYIAGITLCQYHAPKAYAEVKKEYDAKGYKPATKQFKVQAETADEFSDSALYPISVRNNAQMEPHHTSKTRINAAGGANWGSARSWLQWTIEAPESGLYEMAIKFQQSSYVGMNATRTVYVDGEVPYEELKHLKFAYDSGWQVMKTEDESGEPYYIYLSEGTHTLRMEVNLGEMSAIIDRLTTVTYRLNSIYSSVVMLASTSPDKYRDYYYDRRIPSLIDDLKWTREEISQIKESIIEVTGTSSSKTATLESFINQLDILIDDPDEFSKRLEAFKNNITSLSQWIIDNKSQPVSLDYIVFGPADMKLDRAEAGFFKGFWEGTKTFLASFVEDYNVIGAVAGEGRKVKVWVNTGRDQINIINNMVNDEFTPATGINVQLELVQGSLIESTLAGKGPDVALMIASDQPVNYAIRGALVDLSQFGPQDLDGDGKNEVNGFADVYKRYSSQNFEGFAFQMNSDKDNEKAHEGEEWTCEVCGTVNNTGICPTCGFKKYYAYYAVPETQNFNMMFYRKDILAGLGLGVPNTWDDFYAMLPVLRRNNLEVGVLSGTMYQILLYQYGGSFYTEDRHKSGLTTDAAKKAFVEVSDCFIKYDFPITFNFYTRFRSGEMPISIQPYTQFNLINAAAPEIQGLWDMTKVPGTKREDGSIDYAQNVSASGAIMFENTKDKEAAWAFIEWYTRNDMQTRYGTELESIMGAAGRYAAANTEAFRNLAWTRQQTRLLSEQMEDLVGVPEVPGSYFTARTITLAFNDAYIEMENPYKALSERAEDLDDEIARKYEEFGLY